MTIAHREGEWIAVSCAKKNTVLIVLWCHSVINAADPVAVDALVLALKHVKIVLKTFALTVHQRTQLIFVPVLMLKRFTAHHVFRRLLNAQRRGATKCTVPTVSSAMIPMERKSKTLQCGVHVFALVTARSKF